MESPMSQILRAVGAQLAPHLAQLESAPDAKVRLEVTATKASLELLVGDEPLQKFEVAL